MALGSVDLNLLIILQALLEEGNVTRAGLRVGMPQPAMSNALARLRRHYKDELLVRTGNGYALTPLARSLLPEVRETTRSIGSAFSLDSTLHPPPEGRTFSICLSDYSIAVLGRLLLRRVYELAPEVSVELLPAAAGLPDGDRSLLQYDLLIASRGFLAGGQPEEICRDRFVYVADPANPRLRDGRLSLADLAALPHAAAQSPRPEADAVETALHRHGVSPDVVITTAGWLALPFLVAGTDLVAAVPERLARQLSAAGGITVIEPPFGTIELTEVAWWHPTHTTDPALTWLRTVVTDVATSLGAGTPTGWERESHDHGAPATRPSPGGTTLRTPRVAGAVAKTTTLSRPIVKSLRAPLSPRNLWCWFLAWCGAGADCGGRSLDAAFLAQSCGAVLVGLRVSGIIESGEGGSVVLVKRTRLAARRKAAGFSQEMLAERLQVDRSTVVRWEGGESDPQPWKRAALARALGVSLDQLDELLTQEGTAAGDPGGERAGVAGRVGESGGRRSCGGCGLPLSRYNPGDLCQSCMSRGGKELDLVRGGGAAGGGVVLEVHVGERLAALRGEAGLTQEALAERAGFSVDVVRKLEQRRKSGARLSTLRALAGALGVGIGALVEGDAAGDARGAVAGDAEVSSGVAPQDGDDVTRARRDVLAAGWARGDVMDVDDVERRELLRLLGGLGVAAPLVAGADRVRRNLDGALNAPTTDADVTEWERVAAQYSAGSGTVPPAVVLPGLLTDLDEAQARLRDSPDAFRAPMARVCGQLSALAAANFFNAGDEGNARRYWRTALRVIGHADDRPLQAALMSNRASFILLERESSPSAALALADDAIGVAGEDACAGAVQARGTRAMALALLGDHDASARALRDLADSYGRLPGATASARSDWGFSEQQLRFIEGHVHAHAGRVSDAGRALDAGVSIVPAAQVIAVTSFEVNRATSLIRGGDPAEGARHVVRAIGALPAGFRQSATTRRAALALDAVPVKEAGVPAVVEARELLALPPGAGT